MKKFLLLIIFLSMIRADTFVLDDDYSTGWMGSDTCVKADPNDDDHKASTLQDMVDKIEKYGTGDGDTLKICEGTYDTDNDKDVNISDYDQFKDLNITGITDDGDPQTDPSNNKFDSSDDYILAIQNDIKGLRIQNIELKADEDTPLIIDKAEDLNLTNLIIKSQNDKGIYVSSKLEGNSIFENLNIDSGHLP